MARRGGESIQVRARRLLRAQPAGLSTSPPYLVLTRDKGIQPCVAADAAECQCSKRRIYKNLPEFHFPQETPTVSPTVVLRLLTFPGL